MATAQNIRLTFKGEFADTGRMLLYEYGRSQYAFSRILTIVEQYRRNRVIIDRVTPARRVELIVRAPTKGSFQLDVDVDTSPPAASHGVDFETLFALVLDRLIPPGEEFVDVATALAKIKIAELDQGAETGPKLPAHLLGQAKRCASEGEYSNELIIFLTDWAIKAPNRAIARADISHDELERINEIARSDTSRAKLVNALAGQADGAELDRLAAKVRPIFKELAVPLGKSASSIRIGDGTHPAGFYFVDAARLSFIGERVLDEEEVEFDAKIKNFDVETGAGSLRAPQLGGVKRFSLDPAFFDQVKPKVGPAMNKTSVTMVCVRYTDKNGIVTSYLLRDLNY